MAGNELSEAWERAEDALSPGWALRGVIRGPREVDPQIRSASWVAMARPEARQPGQPPSAEGRGGTPVDALEDLIIELRGLDGASGGLAGSASASRPARR